MYLCLYTPSYKGHTFLSTTRGDIHVQCTCSIHTYAMQSCIFPYFRKWLMHSFLRGWKKVCLFTVIYFMKMVENNGWPLDPTLYMYTVKSCILLLPSLWDQEIVCQLVVVSVKRVVSSYYSLPLVSAVLFALG